MDKLTENTVPAVISSDEDGYSALQITQFIVVKFGEEQYGIDIKYVDNIVRMTHITRIPKVADYIKGVINLRGEVVPVMSVRLKMYLDDDVETNATRIIILKLDQLGNIGILVDEVKEVVDLEESQIERVSYDARDDVSNFIYGIGKYEGGLISLLDLDAVVADKDMI